MTRIPLLWAAAALLASCATLPPPAQAPAPTVVLISVDGLRPRDVTPAQMPNAARLTAEGASAPEGMRPSFPSLTFPNHYTLVTGLRPDHHGIVHNSMRDAQLGEFKLSDRAAVGDGRWWGGEPVWVGAQKAGLKTATLFWPGSEAAIDGVRPDRWQAFDASVPPSRRVDTVLAWLAEPEAVRPRFVTLYFDGVDHVEHEHGPDSPEAIAERRATDVQIGRLVDGLRAPGTLDSTDIVLVSDHGFATVPGSHAVAVEDVVASEEASAVSLGQVITFAPNPGFEQQAYARLLGRHDHFECWRKSRLPARWHYGSHPRIPPIVCQMDEGWDMLARATLNKRTPGDRGSHGYDPGLASMRATFIARGPDFKAGSTLRVFDNVDVYPLLMHLLRLQAAPSDGNAHAFDSALRRR